MSEREKKQGNKKKGSKGEAEIFAKAFSCFYIANSNASF
jgi:hypothetical protein